MDFAPMDFALDVLGSRMAELAAGPGATQAARVAPDHHFINVWSIRKRRRSQARS